MQKHGSLSGKVLNPGSARKSNKKFKIRMLSVTESHMSLKTAKHPTICVSMDFL